MYLPPCGWTGCRNTVTMNPVHQREHRVEISCALQSLLRAPVTRADRGCQIEQSHGLDGIRRFQCCARFCVGRFEDLVDFVEQRFDDFDGLAVFLRRTRIVALEVSLVALGVGGLRARESQSTPALHATALQRIHFRQ